jgi:CRISPR-associated protein Csx10
MVTDKECCKPESDMSSACDDLYAVYADSRLIFLDSSGQPHYQPSARDLGFSEGEILWEKSQIRTFGYSSFNSRRGAYNSDYTGIEKGSVLIVKSPVPPSGDEWVGSFKSEGFGHVIYNPSFFKVKEDEDGKGIVSACRFCKADDHDAEYHSGSITDKEAGLVTWLESSRKESDVMSGIFGLNNKMTQFFNASVAASQWGQIRQIAMVSDTYDALRKSIVTFITEGLRKDFWRGKAGKDLMNYLDKDIVELLEQYEADKDRFAPMAVVNLASIMASKPKLSGRSKVNKGE